MAARAEQLRAQLVTTIINKEFTGVTKFKGFLPSFETLVRLHDAAGAPDHNIPLSDEMKRDLLIAILKDPAVAPAKGLDGRRFVGAQSWFADQEEEGIATYQLLVQKLTEKYGDRNDEMTPQLVVSQLRLMKQDGKSVEDYFANFEDTRNKVTAAQLATIMTPYNMIEEFVAGLDPALMKAYVKDNKEFRNEAWDETKKKIRLAEIKHKLGADPIFADNRKKYKTAANDDLDAPAIRHRQQAAKYL